MVDQSASTLVDIFGNSEYRYEDEYTYDIEGIIHWNERDTYDFTYHTIRQGIFKFIEGEYRLQPKLISRTYTIHSVSVGSMLDEYICGD